MSDAIRFGRFLVRGRLEPHDPTVEAALADQEGLDRQVELRVLAVEHQPGSPAHQHFLDEFKAFSVLDHPRVVRAIDGGVLAGRTYYAIAFRRAVTFERLLTGGGPQLEMKTLLALARELTGALAYLHDQGLLFLDFCAGSVCWAAEDSFGYLDRLRVFQRAERLAALPASVPKSAPVRATPEAMLGLAIDRRTDFYLLNAFIYHVATGTSPFGPQYFQPGADGRPALVPVPAQSISGAVTRPVAKILQKAMARDPAERFVSVDEYLEELGRAERRLSIQDEVSKSSVLTASSANIDPELIKEIRRKKEQSREEKEKEARRKRLLEGAQAREGSALANLLQDVKEALAARPILGALPLVVFMFCLGAAWMVGGGEGPGGGAGHATGSATPDPARPHSTSRSVPSTVRTTSTSPQARTTDGSPNGPSTGPGPATNANAERAAALRDPAYRQACADVSKSCQEIRRNSTDKDSFVQRWETLQRWIRKVPRTDRSDKLYTYSTLVAIKLKFYSAPDEASKSLDELYEKSASYLEGTKQEE